LATGEPASGGVVIVGAAAVVIATAALVVGGLRRSNAVNAALVAVTLAGLGVFVWAAYGWGAGMTGGPAGTRQAASLNGVDMGVGIAEAAALCFVAYTGYGRVATLGEEIKDPRRNIPIAVVATLAVSAAAYLLVTLAALYAVGPAGFAIAAEGGATLENVLHMSGAPGWARGAVAIAAVAAMLGVLLNLVLGLSRVALAMGRGGELPKAFAKLDRSGKTPVVAVIGVAVVILLAVATGSIAAAWSFSAVTVLIYYGLTNAAALRLAAKDRIAPKWVSWAGLIGCVGLAAFVEAPYLIAAVQLLGAAAAWHTIARLMR
ncbi:MAG: APC family permease, partial [Planctomycetota bacterium]